MTTEFWVRFSCGLGSRVVSRGADHDLGCRCVGGYKATLNRPGVSEEAKRHAREVLEASGYSVEMPEGSTEDEHDVSFSL